jgi:hypothetical protein
MRTMAKAKDPGKMSLGELLVERAALAEERTALRERQVAVEQMIAFRQATVDLPPELAKRIHLESVAGAKGN